MATLTLEQYLAKIKRQNRELIKKNVPLQIAAQTTHALITNRIFHEGRATDGGPIGSYDDKNEMWVSDDQLRRNGNHRGKPTGLTKSGKPRKRGGQIKTTYFKSYKELKRKQGFNPDVVNLRMKNELQSDFANRQIGKQNNAVPKVRTIKIDAQEYQIILRKQINVDKMEGAEKRFSKRIFAHTEDEKKQFRNVARKELIKFLNQ